MDNGSGDGSVERIRSARPEVHVLHSERNLGYAGGFNLGSRQAISDGAEFLWLLNSDTVISSEALAALLEANARAGPALLSPRINHLDEPERTWYAGGYLTWRLKSHHLPSEPLPDPDHRGLLSVEWATGCSLFLPIELAHRMGPMCDAYFLYLEDVDWSLQAQRLDVPVYCVPAAVIFHQVSASVDKLDRSHVHYYAWRNWYLLIRRHGRWWQRAYGALDLALRLLKTAARLALYPAYRSDPNYLARTQGLKDLLMGRFGQAPQRIARAGRRGTVGEVPA